MGAAQSVALATGSLGLQLGLIANIPILRLTEVKTGGNSISVSADKVMAPIPIQKFNPGFDTDNEFRSHTNHRNIS